VVQFACHPERAFFCEVKDLGALRDASRALRRNKARLARFLIECSNEPFPLQ
jgi:hypothetical protein